MVFFFRKIKKNPANATIFFKHASYYHKHQNLHMRSIRSILLTVSNWEIFNSKSSFYLLLVAFIILLIAAENLIKTAIVPI